MASDQGGSSQLDGMNWVAFHPGDTVTLQAHSPLHKGRYECTVLTVSRTELRIAMPMEHGKLVLLPVGTRVFVESDGGEQRVEAAVADRRSGVERSLVLHRITPKVEGSSRLTAEKELRLCPVVAVTSGKGGVGKSFVTVNLGAALVQLGFRVAIVDVDLGTANVDVLLKLTPHYNVTDIVHGHKTIFEVLVEGPEGLIVLPGGSGFQHLTELTKGQFSLLHDQFKLLQQYVDVVLLDTGSGLSRSVTRFVLAADEAIIVTTPEPHAIVDAYALVKVLAAEGGKQKPLRPKLVINKARDESEAEAVAAKVLFAGERFLQTKMQYLGYVVRDDDVREAVQQQRLLVHTRSVEGAASNVRRIAGVLAKSLQSSMDDESTHPRSEHTGRAPRTFLQRVRALFAR